MKRILLLVAALVGCEQTQTQVVEQCAEDANTTKAADPLGEGQAPQCGPEDAVITELPTISQGTMQAICTLCDDGKCDKLGEPCPAYGALCDFGGAPGVCIACCDGELGLLRCSPVEP